MTALFITDFDLQPLSKEVLEGAQPLEFLGLYGNAVSPLKNPSEAHFADFQRASLGSELYACPSAAKRRGIEIAPPPFRWMSLPAMLERLAFKTLHVALNSDEALARLEALELCLAALALDWQVQLSLNETAANGLRRDCSAVGAKAYGSLPMYGLEFALVAPAAALSLSQDALYIPWRIGRAEFAQLNCSF